MAEERLAKAVHLINPEELNEALETDAGDRDDQDWHLIELAAEKWLDGDRVFTQGTNNCLCDCERSHNGLGLAGRECDCPAGVRKSPQISDTLLIDCRNELERLLFNQPSNRTYALIERINVQLRIANETGSVGAAPEKSGAAPVKNQTNESMGEKPIWQERRE